MVGKRVVGKRGYTRLDDEDEDDGDGVDDDDHNKEALTGRACYQCKSPAGRTHDVGMSALSNV